MNLESILGTLNICEREGKSVLVLRFSGEEIELGDFSIETITLLKDYMKNIRREKKHFHILNKRNKLKRSKMFIDLKALDEACQKYNRTVEEHLSRVEGGNCCQEDIRIAMDIYSKITKVVK